MTEDLEQRTADWFAARLGKVTASRISDVVAKTKSGYGASRANYAAELIAERLTGTTADRFTNAAMQWGTDREPDARAAYEFTLDVKVAEVGFIPHPTIEMSGASPDGHVGEDGLVEIKCPNTATHLETLLGAQIPAKYVLQMQWQMACTGRLWCDFVSYDPRLPLSMQLHIERLDRDDEVIGELEEAVSRFLDEIELKVKELTERYAEAA